MNDTFRKHYATLTADDTSRIFQVKDNAERLLLSMDEAVPLEERSERSRCMAIARTNLEQSIMWAVKAISTK